MGTSACPRGKPMNYWRQDRRPVSNLTSTQRAFLQGALHSFGLDFLCLGFSTALRRILAIHSRDTWCRRAVIRLAYSRQFLFSLESRRRKRHNACHLANRLAIAISCSSALVPTQFNGNRPAFSLRTCREMTARRKEVARNAPINVAGGKHETNSDQTGGG
jgi:hypothetical protein